MGGPVATLAGDDPVRVAPERSGGAPDQDRLEHALLADRATSSARSPMLRAGCFGSGSIAASGTIRPIAGSLRDASSSTKWWSWRIFTRSAGPACGRWRSDTAQDLLGQPVVLVGAGRARREA